jgi:hypothetical protein
MKTQRLMAAKRIEKLLKQALIHDGQMQYELYEYELEELLDEWKSSMAKDKDDYIFSVTENSGHVAMVLIQKTGEVHINEEASSISPNCAPQPTSWNAL